VNLAAILTASARAFGERAALELDERRVTYRALDVASARLAALLRARGVTPGDRVAFMLPSVPEFAVVYYGALRVGAAVVPLDVLLDETELAFYLVDSAARLLLAWHGVAETAEVAAREAGADCLFVTPGELEKLLLTVHPQRDPSERDPSDTAVLLYLPGARQAAELTHGDLARSAHEGTRDGRPLFQSLDASIAAGGCLTLVPRVDAGRRRYS